MKLEVSVPVVDLLHNGTTNALAQPESKAHQQLSEALHLLSQSMVLIKLLLTCHSNCA